MVIAVAKRTAFSAFPKVVVEACLRTELIAAAKIEAELHGKPWPKDAAVQASMWIHVDSLVVVGILCALDEILDCELPESVVRAGGYWSVDKAVKHLMPGIAQEWCTRKGISHEQYVGESGSRGGRTEET